MQERTLISHPGAVGFVLATGILLFAWGCKHGRCENGPTSVAGTERSHHVGENCQSCHLPDGDGKGCWTVAGTIYNPNGTQVATHARVLLFGSPLGQGGEQLSLDDDDLGNVYTSQDVNFSSGLYPAVISAAGDTAFMLEAIRDGACNRCHGNTTERITIP